MTDAEILSGLEGYFAAAGRLPLSTRDRSRIEAALHCLKSNARTFSELVEKAHFTLAERPLDKDEKARDALNSVSVGILNELTPHLQNATWSRDALEATLGEFAETHGMKFGTLAAPLRAALAGRTSSPSVYDMMMVLGQEETLARISEAAA